MQNNSQKNFVNKIYSNLDKIIIINKYLEKYIILIITNIIIIYINDLYINQFRNEFSLKINNNIFINSNIIEKYFNKCFHRYNKTFFSSHILSLKINIFIIIFKNLKFFKIYNEIYTRLTYIKNRVLKT